MRNLIAVLVAVVIVAGAGAAYFLTRDSAPNHSEAATGATSPAPAVQATPSTTQPTIAPDEHVLGKADAPVTIIEYASMTCPHCAAFHKETMPRIKSEFIDKGLVRFVFRPFPLDQLAAAGSLLAQCAPGDAYFSMIDIVFRSQKEWIGASDRLAALKQIGRTAGLADADMDRCLNDKAVIDRIVAGMKEAQEKFQVDSTPTFIVNGQKHGNLPFDDFEEEGVKKSGFGKVIRDLLPKT